MTPDRRLRRAFVAGLAAAAMLPRGGRAQAPRVPRLGLLIAETVAGQAQRLDALQTGLREYGLVDGRTVAIDLRAADGNYEALPKLAADLAGSDVAVIVAFGIKALVAARAATATRPIVIPSTSSDPVAMGLVPKLAGQRTNVTGSVSIGPAIMAKRVELLKEVQPALASVAVLVNPANASFEPMLARMRQAAATLGVALLRQPVRAPQALPVAFDAAAKAGARAIVVQEDTMFAVHARPIADLALRRRMPSAGNAAFADAGGLLGYGASDLALYRRAAYFIDRILKGAQPGDLPIEQATRFEFVANARTARGLGLTLPGSVVLRSDRVVD